MPEFIQHYVAMWTNYFNFSGRTSRPGYWWAVLCNFIVSTVLGYIPYVGTLYALAALIPGLAMGIRRLNDAGKQWTWIFINFVPLIGQIIYIVMLCQPTAPEADKLIEA